ncbi:MAG: alpha/beta hydrolase [Acidobacteria bacterium]|nr:alpha/beta hydrolase [Acidobacteriota bacterium]MBI3470672.1 alpha/beta hydrolase [Candidatus Solibacter usitatus]
MRNASLLVVLVAGLGFSQTGAPPKQTYTYKTAGDLAIEADVYRLDGEAVRPVIFWIHGGALIAGHRGNLRNDQLRRYVDAGYVVVSIDYRLAPETRIDGILDDVRDAYQWVRREGPKLFHADPERVAVVGHSAGGYLTLTCGYRLTPRPRALVSFYGYGEIDAPWYSRPDPFYSQQPAVPKEEAYASVGKTELSGAPGRNQRFRFYLYCRQQGLWPKEVAGRDPDTEPRAFDPFCPARNVTRDFPPTLLLHGDKDTDVPFQQSEQMAELFEKHGVEHEFIRIPGGPHGFDSRISDPQVGEAFERVLAFMARHLK